MVVTDGTMVDVVEVVEVEEVVASSASLLVTQVGQIPTVIVVVYAIVEAAAASGASTETRGRTVFNCMLVWCVWFRRGNTKTRQDKIRQTRSMNQLTEKHLLPMTTTLYTSAYWLSLAEFGTCV